MGYEAGSLEGNISTGDGFSGRCFKQRIELALSHRVGARSHWSVWKPLATCDY